MAGDTVVTGEDKELLAGFNLVTVSIIVKIAELKSKRFINLLISDKFLSYNLFRQYRSALVRTFPI